MRSTIEIDGEQMNRVTEMAVAMELIFLRKYFFADVGSLLDFVLKQILLSTMKIASSHV